MPRPARCYEILIASPGDVTAERDVLVECIEDWNSAHSRTTGIILLPRRWELDVYPELGDRPQGIVNKQIVEGSDMLLGVFWHRIGSPTGTAQSGTVEEIEQFVASTRPVSLYFSQVAVPMSHDPEQLKAVLAYKQRMRIAGVAFDFPDLHEFRRMVSRHLAAKVNALAGMGESVPTKPKSEFARVYIQVGLVGRSGDVKTVRLSAVIENLSPVKRITEYTCTLSIPRACLTHESSIVAGEIASEQKDRRRFRVSDSDPGRSRMIFPGDKLPIFALDLAVDQLKMKGTFLEGDINAALADKVTVEAVVDGELLRDERLVADIFNPKA